MENTYTHLNKAEEYLLILLNCKKKSGNKCKSICEVLTYGKL